MTRVEFQIGRAARNTVLALAVGSAGLGLIPATHPDNTRRILDALSGKEPKCPLIRETHQEEGPVDTLAVLAAGVEEDKHGHAAPNTFEKMRLDAAAVAFIQGRGKSVTLLDGVLEQHVDPNVNKTYLQKKVVELSHGNITLTDDQVFIDSHSLNTWSNLRELKTIMQRHTFSSALIVTNRFHKNRTEILLCTANMPYQVVPAEEILSAYNDTYVEYIATVEPPARMTALENQERLKLFDLLFDPNSFMTTGYRILQQSFKPTE